MDNSPHYRAAAKAIEECIERVTSSANAAGDDDLNQTLGRLRSAHTMAKKLAERRP